MKWYNFETMFTSLKNELRDYLNNTGVRFEISGCGAGYHFEIYTDRNGADRINRFIDSVTITEKK